MTNSKIGEIRRRYNTARAKVDRLRKEQIYSKHDRGFLESVSPQVFITERQEQIIDEIFEKYIVAICRQDEGGAI
jgi:hypothetical protein